MKGLGRAVLALLRRDLAEQLSYKAALALEAMSIAAHAVVYYFIAHLIGPAAGAYLGRYGGDYFPFALLGLAVANYHRAALSGLASALSREQDGGTLEIVWMTPAGIDGVLAAGWIEEFILATFRVAAYLGIGLALGAGGALRPDLPAAAAAVALTMSALTGFGLMSAAFLLVHKRGEPVSPLLDGASRLLSGVYFPVAVLPVWLQRTSKFLPLTPALEALRKSLLSGTGLSGIGPELGLLALWTAAVLPLGFWTFRRAVERARRDGSLALR